MVVWSNKNFIIRDIDKNFQKRTDLDTNLIESAKEDIIYFSLSSIYFEIFIKMHDFSKSPILGVFCAIVLLTFVSNRITPGRRTSLQPGEILPESSPAKLTVQLPVEKYGLPGEVDEKGEFHLRLPPEVKRVFFEVGLFSNPSFCDLPSRHPDVFVVAWEANEESWAMHHDRCFKASGGKYVALPFAAADSENQWSGTRTPPRIHVRRWREVLDQGFNPITG